MAASPFLISPSLPYQQSRALLEGKTPVETQASAKLLW